MNGTVIGFPGVTNGNALGVPGLGGSTGSIETFSVYGFLDLAGTAGAIITPTLLNACMNGAVPGTWGYGAAEHSNVQTDPVDEYFHTFLRSQTEYAIDPPLLCDGVIFDAVTRNIEWDQSQAVTPDDWETVKWTPGETISGNFMAVYCLEIDRTVGADTGGTSVDVCTIYYGGVFAVVQQRILADGLDPQLRAHGGVPIPIANNVRYRIQHLANKGDELCQFAVLNDTTGAFIGSCQFAFIDPIDLTSVIFGDYLTNGDGQGNVSGLYYLEGADAVFHGFTVPDITGGAVTQTGVDELTPTWESSSATFLVERKTGAGSYSVLNASFQPSRIDTTETCSYGDGTVSDATAYTYRISATVGNLASASVEIGPIAVDNSSQPAAQDTFDAYDDATDLDDAANWVAESGTITVKKISAEGTVYPGATAVGIYRHTTAPAGGDQRIEITIGTVGAGGSFDMCGGSARVQTGAATCYGVVFSAGDLYLLSSVAGTVVTINSDTGMALEAGDRIALEAIGTGAATRLRVQVDTGSGWVDKWTDQNPAADIDGGSFGLMTWLLAGQGNRVTEWKAFDA